MAGPLEVSIAGSGAINQSASPPNMTIYGTRTQEQVATLIHGQYTTVMHQPLLAPGRHKIIGCMRRTCA